MRRRSIAWTRASAGSSGLKKTRQFDNTLILFLQDNGGCAEAMGRGAYPASG